MVGHGGSSAGSYLADPTSPIPSHCASIVATSTVRVNFMSATSGHQWETASMDGIVSSIKWHSIMAEAVHTSKGKYQTWSFVLRFDTASMLIHKYPHKLLRKTEGGTVTTAEHAEA